jgi:acylphosphatase
MTRLTAHFEGHVQGVGFRVTTQNIAREHAVAGYVQNLADGRVCLVAEGEQAAVEAFYHAVFQRFSSHIRAAPRCNAPATGEFGKPAPGALTIRY